LIIFAEFLQGGFDLDQLRDPTALRRVYRPIYRLSPTRSFSRAARLARRCNLDHTPAYLMADSLARMFSPYELNPGNLNPLRDFIYQNLDAAAIRAAEPFKLFVSATNARTGEPRVFARNEITPDVFLASAYFPLVFQAVEIDGKPYWDGGYMGNPPLCPLIEQCDSGDIVIVPINPIVRDRPLRTAPAILNRLNEITMNASLQHELRLIAVIQDLIADSRLTGSATAMVRKTYIHMISAAATMIDLGVASKISGEVAFLEYLRDVGRASADAWLEASFEALGHRSSFDLQALCRRQALRPTASESPLPACRS